MKQNTEEIIAGILFKLIFKMELDDNERYLIKAWLGQSAENRGLYKKVMNEKLFKESFRIYYSADEEANWAKLQRDLFS